MRKEPAEVASVACIGGGTIGSGWAAQFLGAGLDVVGWDPAPDGEARMRRLVDAAWPALSEFGLAAGASPERLRYAGSLAEAVGDVDFVQESAPELRALKTGLLAEIDAAAPPEVVIASSTSGLDLSELQSQCARPERTVVGHPFNPVYMVPLVEVAPGRRTSEETPLVEVRRDGGPRRRPCSGPGASMKRWASRRWCALRDCTASSPTASRSPCFARRSTWWSRERPR